MLLVIASKTITRAIQEGMKEAIEPKLRDEQTGFRAERSCCEQIATMWILIEQSLEWNSGLYMSFVDFAKAFNSVDHSSLWSFLWHYVLPDKIDRMIKAMYEGFKASVIHEGTTQGFKVKSSIKQGWFNFAHCCFWLHWTWKQGSKKTGIQWSLTRQLEDPEFADDLCLLSHKITLRRQKINTLRQNSEGV